MYISTHGTRAIYFESGVWYCFSDWYPSIFQLQSIQICRICLSGTLITQVKPSKKSATYWGWSFYPPKKGWQILVMTSIPFKWDQWKICLDAPLEIGGLLQIEPWKNLALQAEKRWFFRMKYLIFWKPFAKPNNHFLRLYIPSIWGKNTHLLWILSPLVFTT